MTAPQITVHLSAYRKGYEKLKGALEDLSEAEMTQRIADVPWSIKEIVGHLATAELFRAEYLRRVVAEDCPRLIPFDAQLYAQALLYQSRDTTLALQLFGVLRTQTIELLDQLPVEAWSRRGYHLTEGDMTVTRLVERSVQETDKRLKEISLLRRHLRR